MKQPLKLTTRQGERIAVVAGLRTPFAKQATAFHGVPAVDLGKLVVSEMLARTDLDPMLIDQLVFGQVVQGMEVLDKLAQVQTGYSSILRANDVPTSPIILKKVVLLADK